MPLYSVVLATPQSVVAGLRMFLTVLRAAGGESAEFRKLSALSDAELARRGLTRAVLKRHLRQKSAAR